MKQRLESTINDVNRAQEAPRSASAKHPVAASRPAPAPRAEYRHPSSRPSRTVKPSSLRSSWSCSPCPATANGSVSSGCISWGRNSRCIAGCLDAATGGVGWDSQAFLESEVRSAPRLSQGGGKAGLGRSPLIKYCLEGSATAGHRSKPVANRVERRGPSTSLRDTLRRTASRSAFPGILERQGHSMKSWGERARW